MLSGLSRRAEAVARRAVELEPMPQPPLCPTRYPVVLLHGFGALANLMQGGVLHAEAMHLRGRGVWAYAPHVNPYDTVEVRAEAWAERLTRVLAETGADEARLNPLGGAIALGHPLGASGAVLMTRMVNHMRDNNIRYGLQTMCEGGGTANATLVELIA